MYVYIYMHIRTINEKRGHNLKKKNKEGYMREVEREEEII